MLTANEIRQQFLDFFKEKGHQIVPSAPIVVKNDPTLLFTNAGMNQFKDYFLGNKQATHTRIADTQKCLRVSGKHNDLEEVGVDTYHHTMFEMLGNWSFGDYFKEEAIAWSWELLTTVLHLPKDRLYVTVFEGDEKENLPKDEEAYNYWKQHIAEDRILLGNKKDNFWEMGDIGPCGPCTEIHVDCRSDEERAAIEGKHLVNADHPQVIEIWNNVFIQFNRMKDGTLGLLPAKHVDTGMGLERLVRVLQGKQSNYDTDLFTGTISAIEKITHHTYTRTDSKADIAFRVLADHIRAIAFTIADGQLPSNTGAGYVIRRILRRAVRYYYSYLDYKQPLLFQLLLVLAKQFEFVFPELLQQLDFVTKVVKEEEEAFLRTLGKGLRRIKSYTIDTERNGRAVSIDAGEETEELGDLMRLQAKYREEISHRIIAGEFAFELHDTFGFPIDLTKLIANENSFTVDVSGFETELLKQKNRSRAATALDTDDWVVLKEINSQKFVGYTQLEAETNVVKYRKVTGKGKESYQIVLDVTPFYAESGGQVGDTGELVFPNDRIRITDTKKDNDLIIHFADSLPDNISATAIAKVARDKRKDTTLHHSATHLLHAALRMVLGTHVAQKGSLVNESNLRFDFSHFAKMAPKEVQQVEAIVNEKIRANVPVVIKELPKDEAIALGAMALFGEKYGDTVRVVIMDPNYSIELCGGTHVGYSGELGLFKITSESAVAAGVRRVEAISGKAAENYMNEQLQQLLQIQAQLKNAKDPVKAIEKLQDEKAALEKYVDVLEMKELVILRNELLTKQELVGDITFVGATVTVNSADGLKKLCSDILHHAENSLVVLCATVDGKASVAVGVSETLVKAKQLDAGKIIKEIVAPLIKGGGGGQKTLATAGGQDASQFSTVINKVKALL